MSMSMSTSISIYLYTYVYIYVYSLRVIFPLPIGNSILGFEEILRLFVHIVDLKQRNGHVGALGDSEVIHSYTVPGFWICHAGPSSAVSNASSAHLPPPLRRTTPGPWATLPPKATPPLIPRSHPIPSSTNLVSLIHPSTSVWPSVRIRTKLSACSTVGDRGFPAQRRGNWIDFLKRKKRHS